MRRGSIVGALAVALLVAGCSNSGISGCKGRSGSVKTGPNTLYLPYPSGDSHTVGQSWQGSYSHASSGGEHALDFTMNYNEKITPVAAGRVIAVKEDSAVTCAGPCPDGNYVVIDHGNGFLGRYFHFCQNCVDVVPGQLVNSGTQLGGAGTTGWSTGIHLHFELADWEEGCSVTYGFANINSGARTALAVGSSYTSSNPGNTTYTPSTIGGATYTNVGVTLTSTIPWYLNSGSSIQIAGSFASTHTSSDAVAVMLVDMRSNSVVEGSKVITSVTSPFDFNYTIPAVTAGTYSLAISASQSGSYQWNNPPQIVIY